MATDDSDEIEETVSQSSTSESSSVNSDSPEEVDDETIEARSSELTEADYMLLSAQRDAESVYKSAMLSEAALDLAVHTLQVIFGVVGIVLILITATTSLSLWPAIGGLALVISVLGAMKDWVKSIDEKF